MGRYGAVMLAGRHPDLFVAGTSLSGAVDTIWAPGSVVSSASPAIDSALPDAIYGPRVTDEVIWPGHNPQTSLGIWAVLTCRLYGQPCPWSPRTGKSINALRLPRREWGCLPGNTNLNKTLIKLGVQHKYSAYSWGCHTPEMFQQQITDTLPRFADAFSRNVPPPAKL